MAFRLHSNKHVRQVLNVLRKFNENGGILTRSIRGAMIQCAINLEPRLIASRSARSDQQIRARFGDAMKESIVRRAARPSQIGLRRFAAFRGRQVLGGLEEISGLQSAPSLIQTQQQMRR